MAAIYSMEQRCRTQPTPDTVAEAKRMGFSDEHLLSLIGETDDGRWTMDDDNLSSIVHRPSSIVHRMRPTYKMVDTCAGEFAASTPYFYSCYESEDEAD